MPQDLLPPWLEYPEIKFGSIGWRMGYGEEYLIKFKDWFQWHKSGWRAEYRNRYPEPEEWADFYERQRWSE